MLLMNIRLPQTVTFLYLCKITAGITVIGESVIGGCLCVVLSFCAPTFVTEICPMHDNE